MSIIKSEKNQTEKSSDDPRYKVTPRYGVWSKDEIVTIQIAIPGVKKEDIDMRVLPNYFTLRAPRGEVMYALDLELTKVEPDVSKAKYEEGLLKVELKRYNPLEHAFDVKIE
ncbi:hypothetical protein NEF87_000264 [Candidatus Lokiarchaeum ossiferum]|uniref:Hsp20/alpha crystallin family protein n=1 Tax=Candidatus Lokiarchaeum ossiferum TaxID=2951803 RepID=A0ABY6HNA5_9ARCH|nr:hypothetical protein NEF87_000264 [Candidatus Lokiarchaeum sp. B-35]